MNSAFSKSAAGILIATAAALFALSLILAAREDAYSGGESAGPGVNSASAVGYAGMYDVMRRMDLPVKRSAKNPSRDAGSRGVLVAAEPARRFLLGADAGSGVWSDAKRLLFVLPKWRWTVDFQRPSWVSEMSAADLSEARRALAFLTADGSTVFRADAPGTWSTNEFPFSPEISGVVQLLHPSEKMRTLVGDGNGALLAEMTEEDRTIWILADPDVMSNHGFMKGDNAAFMISALNALSRIGNEDFSGKIPIVFDETIHGFVSENDSLLKMMLSFPYAIVAILGVIWVVLLAAAGAGRFGVPERAERAIDFGKARLIDNCARLLDYGGHHAVTLRRYARSAIKETARALHVPEGLSEAETAEVIDRIGRSRNVSVSCSSIMNYLASDEKADRPDIPGLIETARLAHKWKGEISNGPGIHRERH
jgi:hypothetical protein